MIGPQGGCRVAIRPVHGSTWVWCFLWLGGHLLRPGLFVLSCAAWAVVLFAPGFSRSGGGYVKKLSIKTIN
jgi:hypothetical protein